MRLSTYVVALSLCGAVWGGCGQRVDLDEARRTVARMTQTAFSDSMRQAGQIADSILALKPMPRLWNDSLARADSLGLAFLFRVRTAHFYEQRDTVQALLSFAEAMPWTRVWDVEARMAFWSAYISDAKRAMALSQSAHLAQLTYQGFQHAEELALVHDNLSFYRGVLQAKFDFGVALRHFPDSVQAAFSPAPLPESLPMSKGGTVAVGLILALTLGGGGVWIWRSQMRRRGKDLEA